MSDICCERCGVFLKIYPPEISNSLPGVIVKCKGKELWVCTTCAADIREMNVKEWDKKIGGVK